MILASLILKEGVQGLQSKPRFKTKRRVKCKDDICAELCLKL